MRITARANTAALRSRFDKIAEYQRSEMLKTAGKTIVIEILKATAEGKDAEGNPFSPYGKSQREKRLKHNLSVDVKTLWFSGDMLKSLQWWDGENIVSVSAAFRKIAEGQMYHPKWKDASHSKFLLLGGATQIVMEEAIKKELDKL